MPKLDMGALKKAIAKGQAAAVGSAGPGGWVRTGTKAFVREHLDTILQLREDTHATWGQMVAALAEHYELRQGDGKPITGRRLNALVSACLKERAREEAAVVARASRKDLTSKSEPAGARRPLAEADREASVPKPAAETPEPSGTGPLTEDEIRRGHVARHQHLFKRG